MSLINRYILKAHIAPFAFGFSVVIFLFLMQFLMKYLDKLVGKGLDTWVIFQLIIYNISWMVVLAVPMGVLFSTLMAFGSLSSAHEITIIKASGGSLLRMMRPVIFAGIILMAGLFYFNDQILPDTNHKSKMLMSDITRLKPTFAVEAGQFSTQIEGYTILSRKVDSLTGTLFGVTIYDRTRTTQTNIASADTGYLHFSPDYSKLILKLKKGEVHQFYHDKVNNYKIINFDDYLISMNAEGFNFQRSGDDMISRGDREMKISDMRAIVAESEHNIGLCQNQIESDINKHYQYLAKGVVSAKHGVSETEVPNAQIGESRRASYMRISHRLNLLNTQIRTTNSVCEDHQTRADKYKVEIHKKYVLPFACFLFIFVGCPLGIVTKGGNFGLSAAMSLGFYIFYWASLIGGEKLADRGIMSPGISMWFGNMIIAVLGIILTLKVNYESLDFLNLKRFFVRKKAAA